MVGLFAKLGVPICPRQRNSPPHRSQEPDPDTASTSPARSRPEPDSNHRQRTTVPRPCWGHAPLTSRQQLDQRPVQATLGHDSPGGPLCTPLAGLGPPRFSNAAHRCLAHVPSHADRDPPSAAAENCKTLHACRKRSVQATYGIPDTSRGIIRDHLHVAHGEKENVEVVDSLDGCGLAGRGLEFLSINRSSNQNRCPSADEPLALPCQDPEHKRGVSA